MVLFGFSTKRNFSISEFHTQEKLSISYGSNIHKYVDLFWYYSEFLYLHFILQ